MSYRLVVFPVRGGKLLIGARGTLDAAARVPSKLDNGDTGTVFATLPNARGYAARELAGLSSYFRAEIIDGDGDVVQVGPRSGYNGCGRRFMWSDVRYEVHEGRPSWHQQRAGAISAGVTVQPNKAAAVAYAARVRESRPGERVFVMPERGRA